MTTGVPQFARLKSVAALVVVAAGLWPVAASAADKQIRPFIGATFGGQTTFLDFDSVTGKPNIVFGVSVVTLGDVFGVDVDLADAPGFFEGNDHIYLNSRVTTLTGNVVIAAPRRLTEYILRPYFVGGAGLMRIHADDYFGAFKVERIRPAFDLGGGVLMFFTNTVGASFEVRRFQNFYHSSDDAGLTLTGSERLSFWRAGLSLAIRY
jgi:outer membrane protein with beta-barrel domain